MELQFSIRDQQCPNGCGAPIRINSRKKQRVQCTACGRTWAIYRNQDFFGLRAGRQKITRAKVLMLHGQSVRMIAHVIGVSPSTVQRWKSILHNQKTPC